MNVKQKAHISVIMAQHKTSKAPTRCLMCVWILVLCSAQIAHSTEESATANAIKLMGFDQPLTSEPKLDPVEEKTVNVEPYTPSSSTQLWGTEEFFNPSLDVLPKWQRVLKQIESEEPTYAACKKSKQNCQTLAQADWRAFMEEMQHEKHKDRTSLEVLDLVNNFFNQWDYIEDIYNWQKSDYWASPQEFLQKAGDCEDYAIIKYVTLKKLGVNVEQMRLVVVRDIVRNLAHAVLAVYSESGGIYILDSLMNETLPQNAMLQYTPYYSVNETGRWVHIAPIKE